MITLSSNFITMASTLTADNRNMIIKIAKLFLNSPYEFWWEGKLPWDPTDCSNFTQNILSQVGINLERASFQQWEQFENAKSFHEDIKKAEIGDVIFFKNTYQSENEITHVWIYAGDNTMIHAWSPKVAVVNLAGYRRSHFKAVGSINSFAKNYDDKKAKKNFERLGGVIDVIPDSNQETETLKAVNAVIAVLTSTWADLPENFQDVSASYAKSLRDTYPKARKLEKEQAKKVYQSIVDFLSYAYKYAWAEEQKKYWELAQYLRNKFGLK